MKAQRLFVNIILGIALVSACQSTETITLIQTEQHQPTAIRTKTVKAKPSTATSTSLPQFSAEGASPETPTVPPKTGGGVQLSLSPQAMQGVDTIASEYPGVKEEMFFSGGFGGGMPGICLFSEMSEPPMIGYETHPYVPLLDLCLIGFPEGKPIQLDLYAPDGSLVSTEQITDQGFPRTFVIYEENGEIIGFETPRDEAIESGVKVWEDINIQSYSLWTPVGLPKGEWRMVASANGITRELIMPMPTKTEDSNLISVLPSLTIDPFLEFDCWELKSDDSVYIAGSGFLPNIKIPLGIYYSTSEVAPSPDGDSGEVSTKIFGTLVSVSDRGDFLLRYPIAATAPDGYYMVYPFVEDSHWIDIKYSRGGTCFRVNTGNGTPTPRARAPQADNSFCPGAPVSRLNVGDRASISLVPPNPNTVREKPGRKQNRLGLLQPGEKIEILAGPRCADGWIWWKVVSLETGLDGWTSEGDMENYWIVPEK